MSLTKMNKANKIVFHPVIFASGQIEPLASPQFLPFDTSFRTPTSNSPIAAWDDRFLTTPIPFQFLHAASSPINPCLGIESSPISAFITRVRKTRGYDRDHCDLSMEFRSKKKARSRLASKRARTEKMSELETQLKDLKKLVKDRDLEILRLTVKED